MTAQPRESAISLLRFCEGEQTNLIEQFPGVAKHDGYGPRVVLIFDDPQDYYNYIAHYYPDEGRFAGSGGIFLTDGYRHIALPFIDMYQACGTLRHEIVHACVSHLPLPLWLNEGFTALVERNERSSSQFKQPLMLDQRMVLWHQRFWNAERIQDFWSGKSFHVHGDSQELSYNLAAVLVDIIISDCKRFPEFLCAANRRDAGERAALDLFGLSLGDIVANFLGDGCWSPNVHDEETAVETGRQE